VTSLVNNSYHPPNFQLTYDQLKSLTSNSLFIQFCNEIDQNEIINHMGIRQFINKLTICNDIQQIRQVFFSAKKKSPK